MAKLEDTRYSARYRVSRERMALARRARTLIKRIDVAATMLERARAELHLVAEADYDTALAEPSARSARRQLYSAKERVRSLSQETSILVVGLTELVELEAAEQFEEPADDKPDGGAS